jgi:cytochrome c oxidase subunit 2
MSSTRHFTTRRDFVAGMGFGGLGLYATWAAYGASPLPFTTGHTDADIRAHSDAAAGQAMADMSNMTGGGHMSADDFMRRHTDFLQRFQDADGAVRPVAAGSAVASTHAPAVMGMGDSHAGDGEMSMPMPRAATPAIGHDHAAAQPQAFSASEVYFLAGRFSFEPDRLHLQTGQLYRFQMMAIDVAHGASIAFGQASRIVRLRPDTVTTLDLTFREAGTHLVYCTVYCGLGHDGMHGLITVA